MKEDKSKLQLIGEIAEANNKNLELIEEINKLSNKIYKAIEYIEENEFKASDGEVCYFCNMQVIKDLLDILRGEDNE